MCVYPTSQPKQIFTSSGHRSLQIDFGTTIEVQLQFHHFPNVQQQGQKYIQEADDLPRRGADQSRAAEKGSFEMGPQQKSKICFKKGDFVTSSCRSLKR